MAAPFIILEDERMEMYASLPLLVLSEEAFYFPSPGGRELE